MAEKRKVSKAAVQTLNEPKIEPTGATAESRVLLLFEQMQTEIRAIADGVVGIHRRLDETREELLAVDEKTKILASAVRQNSEEIRKNSKDLGDLKHELAGLKKEVAGIKDDVAGVKQNVAVVKEEVGGLKDDVAGLKKDVAGLKKDVAGLNQDVASLGRDFVGMTQEVTGFKQDLLGLKHEVSELRQIAGRLEDSKRASGLSPAFDVATDSFGIRRLSSLARTVMGKR